MTSRRGFLGAIAAALTLDPERALWVPGKKLISVPAPRPLPSGEASIDGKGGAWQYWMSGNELYRSDGRIVEHNIGVELWGARCSQWEREVRVPA